MGLSRGGPKLSTPLYLAIICTSMFIFAALAVRMFMCRIERRKCRVYVYGAGMDPNNES